MKINNIIALCFAAALFNSQSSRGDIYIDGYSAGQFLPGTINGTPICTNGSASDGDILGYERNVQTCAIDALIGGGQVQIFEPPNDYGFITFTYAGLTGAYNGIGDIDLTQGGTNNCFSIGFSSINNGGGSLTITLRSVPLAGSTITVPLPTSPGPLNIHFGAFQTVAPAATHLVNFNDVGFIEWMVQLNPGASYTMGPVKVASAPNPQLSITASGANLIVAWPTNAAQFVLQATTNLGSAADWSTNLPKSVIVGDHNAVTNPITGEQVFFRLMRSF